MDKEIDLHKLHINMKPSFQIDRRLAAGLEQSARMVNRTLEEQRAREEEVLERLRSIDNNTAQLSTMVHLLQTSNENSETIIFLLTEIMRIGALKTPEEVESKYKQVVKKISDTVQDAQNMQYLLDNAKLAYTLAMTYLNSPT